VLRGLRLLTPVAALTFDCKYTLAILRCAGSDEVPTVSRNSHYHLASIIAKHTGTNTHTHNFVSLPRFLSFSDTHTHARARTVTRFHTHPPPRIGDTHLAPHRNAPRFPAQLPSTPVAALVSSLGAVPNSGAPALLLLSLLFGIMKPLLASTRPSPSAVGACMQLRLLPLAFTVPNIPLVASLLQSNLPPLFEPHLSPLATCCLTDCKEAEGGNDDDQRTAEHNPSQSQDTLHHLHYVTCI
jgi:hypothetical protein